MVTMRESASNGGYFLKRKFDARLVFRIVAPMVLFWDAMVLRGNVGDRNLLYFANGCAVSFAWSVIEMNAIVVTLRDTIAL